MYPAWREQEHRKVNFHPMVDTLINGTRRHKLRLFYDSMVKDRRSYELRPVFAGILAGFAQYQRRNIINSLTVYRRLQIQVHAIFHNLLLPCRLCHWTRSLIIQLLNFVASIILPDPLGPPFIDRFGARCCEIWTSKTSTAWQRTVCRFLLADGI